MVQGHAHFHAPILKRQQILDLRISTTRVLISPYLQEQIEVTELQ